MKRFLDASRVLIASSVVLAAALAFLLYQRLRAPPPSAPPAAAAAAAHAEPPRGPEPVHAPARPDEARPAEEAARVAAGPAKPAEAPPHAGAEPAGNAGAPDPAASPPSQATTASPKAKPRPRKQGASALADDAAAAIFVDRPASDGEGPRQKTPRIPVLRKPAAGVAPAAYAAAVPRPGGSPPSAGARPPPAPRASAAPSPATASSHAAALAPLPGPSPAPSQARASPAGQPLPGAVSGTLRGAASAPIAGATVLAVSAAGDDAFETISDDDGFYLLAGLRSGRYLLFTGLGARPAPALPARAVEVQDGRVARLDLREPGAGTTVRVRPLLADGRPLPGQALLVAGPPPSAATFQSLLRSDAVFLPEAGAPTVLRRVPAGVYTLVVLQADATLRVAKQPVTVRGDGEQALEVRFPADLAAAPGG